MNEEIAGRHPADDQNTISIFHGCSDCNTESVVGSPVVEEEDADSWPWEELASKVYDGLRVALVPNQINIELTQGFGLHIVATSPAGGYLWVTRSDAVEPVAVMIIQAAAPIDGEQYKCELAMKRDETLWPLLFDAPSNIYGAHLFARKPPFATVIHSSAVSNNVDTLLTVPFKGERSQ